MTEAFDEALKNNAPEKAGALQAEIGQFLKALETMHEKEQMVVTYLPGTGTTVTIRGQGQGDDCGPGIRSARVLDVARPEAAERGPQERVAREEVGTPTCCSCRVRPPRGSGR